MQILASGGASSPLVYASLNPADTGAGYMLQLGNLLLGVTSGPGPITSRANVSFSTQKIYWETFSSIDNASITNFGRGGVCNSSQTLTALMGATANGLGVNPTSGAIVLNGSTLATIGEWQDAGDILQQAVDATARRYWARVNGTGNWNNSGTANPATGVGGLDISGITGALYPALSAQNSGGNANFDYGINLGSYAFTYSVPSGFTGGLTV